MWDPFTSFPGAGFGGVGGLTSTLMDPFADVFPSSFGVGIPSFGRRARRRMRRELQGGGGGQQQQQITGPAGAGDVTAGAGGDTGGMLTPFTGQDVGFFDWDRLLTEPLAFGLEDRDNEYRLHVAQPRDLRKRDLHVEVDNGMLTVSGDRTIEERGRRRQVSYHRSVTLPDNVNQDDIEANYNQDGTLDIKMPKVKGTTKRKVLLKGGEEGSESLEEKGGSETGTSGMETTGLSGAERSSTSSGTQETGGIPIGGIRSTSGGTQGASTKR